MIGRPPRSTLFPSPPLFRSERFVRLFPPGPLELGASPSGEQIGGIGSGERLQPLRKTAHVEERSVQIEGHDREAHFGLTRSEEHTSELQSPCNLVCRLLLEK